MFRPGIFKTFPSVIFWYLIFSLKKISLFCPLISSTHSIVMEIPTNNIYINNGMYIFLPFSQSELLLSNDIKVTSNKYKYIGLNTLYKIALNIIVNLFGPKEPQSFVLLPSFEYSFILYLL